MSLSLGLSVTRSLVELFSQPFGPSASLSPSKSIIIYVLSVTKSIKQYVLSVTVLTLWVAPPEVFYSWYRI